MDDLGVKTLREEDKKHLLDSLNQRYKVTIDNEGTRYLRITLEWDYKNLWVHLSMPGYLPKSRKQFIHEPTPKIQDQTYPYPPQIMKQR